MLELCTNHTGKMEGMHSLSTSTIKNPNCRANAENPNTICAHCYAEAMCAQYENLSLKLDRNTEQLTTRIIPIEELPDTSDVKIFRFESFGDLINETQLTNYLNIVNKNPGTRFTLWTKMYKLVYNYFKTHDVPENFTLILSSLFTNQIMPLTAMKSLGKFAPGQLKVFTVFTKEYLAEHPEVDINCGSRLCMGCQKCYLKNEIEEINEILKADQNVVGIMMSLRNEEHLQELINAAEGIEDINF